MTFLVILLSLIFEYLLQTNYNRTTHLAKNGLIVLKSIVPDGFLIEIKLDGSMLSTCS